RRIARGHLLEQPVEAVEEQRERQTQIAPDAGPLILAVRLQEQRGERRRERQRDGRRDDGRGRDGERKLTVELTRDSGDERCRDEYRAQHQRNGDQRAADLVHGLLRRLLPPPALAP